MAVCARAILQTDGSYLLGLDPSVSDITTCSYVVLTGAESVQGSLLELTPDQALLISGYVAGLWALAWTFKQVARAFEGNQNETEN